MIYTKYANAHGSESRQKGSILVLPNREQGTDRTMVYTIFVHVVLQTPFKTNLVWLYNMQNVEARNRETKPKQTNKSINCKMEDRRTSKVTLCVHYVYMYHQVS